MKRLPAFIAAFIGHWVGFVMGSILFAAIFVWEHYSSQTIPWGYTAACLLLGFFYSAFRTWEEKNNECSELKRKLDEKPLSQYETREQSTAIINEAESILKQWMEQGDKPQELIETTRQMIQTINAFAAKRYSLPEVHRLEQFTMPAAPRFTQMIMMNIKDEQTRHLVDELNRVKEGLVLLRQRIVNAPAYSATVI